MKIRYDHEVDALYILFKDTTFTTKLLAEGIAADYDAQGRLAGIEILDAMKRLDDPTTAIADTPDGEAPVRPRPVLPSMIGPMAETVYEAAAAYRKMDCR